MYERPADRRFAHDSPGQALEKDWEKDWEKDQEAAMLLDPAARLGGDGTYVR